MKYELTDDELNYAEQDTIECVERFMCGWQDWNEDNVLKMACDFHGHDYDFAWLATRVLFGPAVVYFLTGKSV